MCGSNVGKKINQQITCTSGFIAKTYPVVCGRDDLDLEDSTFGVRLHHGIVDVVAAVQVRALGRGLQKQGKKGYQGGGGMNLSQERLVSNV